MLEISENDLINHLPDLKVNMLQFLGLQVVEDDLFDDVTRKHCETGDDAVLGLMVAEIKMHVDGFEVSSQIWRGSENHALRMVSCSSDSEPEYGLLTEVGDRL